MPGMFDYGQLDPEYGRPITEEERKEQMRLEDVSTEELQAELKRRESELDEDFKKAIEVISQRFAHAPSYISQSRQGYKLEYVLDELGVINNNWNNPEAWNYSDMCW